jgi:glucokinase
VTDVVLAIDFGGTKTAVGCVSASGELLLSRRLPTAPTADIVRRALESAARLRAEAASRPGWRLIGAGAVSPGVVLGDRILLAPNMPGWESLSLPGALRAGLPGLPVATGNDVHAAALAEARWGNLRGRDGLYVNLGTGLAAAIVLDGRVIRGRHGAAGEIGYARGKDGRTLEEVIGGGALGSRASEIAGRTMSAAEAFAAADPRVRLLVEDAIAEFARYLANLATLLDPERVVIGGGLANAGDRLLGPLRETFEKICPFPAEIVTSAFARDASLFGAAALAITSGGQ